MDTMIYISPPDYSFVLTNALFETDKEHAWFDEISALAAKRQSRFLPVLLTISPEEHVRRINTPERQARFKETDQTAPARYAAADNLIKLSHPDLITLDVTCLSPSDAAARILGHLA